MWPAVLAAGPLFVTSTVLAAMYVQLPRAIDLTPGAVTGFLAALGLSAVFGFLLAIAPNLLGALLMRWLAARFPIAASPLSWTLAGGLTGVGIAAALGLNDPWDAPIAFGFVATSMACAYICWRRVQRRAR